MKKVISEIKMTFLTLFTFVILRIVIVVASIQSRVLSFCFEAMVILFSIFSLINILRPL